MLFVVICRDRTDALELRRQTRPAHLAWIGTLGDAVRGAGPMLDAQGNPRGSILFFEMRDRATLDAVLVRDPYAKAGLFASVEVSAFSWSVPPAPGA